MVIDERTAESNARNALPLELQPYYEDGVTFEITPDKIRVYPNNSVRGDFPEVFVEVRRGYDDKQVVEGNLQTLDSQGNQHPYFQRHEPADIAAGAIVYLDSQLQFHGFRFIWDKPDGMPSINYERYIAARDRLVPRELDTTTTADNQALKQSLLRQAVLESNAWTLRNIAQRHGFTELPGVIEVGSRQDPRRPKSVQGIIYRPQYVPQ